MPLVGASHGINGIPPIKQEEAKMIMRAFTVAVLLIIPVFLLNVSCDKEQPPTAKESVEKEPMSAGVVHDEEMDTGGEDEGVGYESDEDVGEDEGAGYEPEEEESEGEDMEQELPEVEGIDEDSEHESDPHEQA